MHIYIVQLRDINFECNQNYLFSACDLKKKMTRKWHRTVYSSRSGFGVHAGNYEFIQKLKQNNKPLYVACSILYIHCLYINIL